MINLYDIKGNQGPSGTKYFVFPLIDGPRCIPVNKLNSDPKGIQAFLANEQVTTSGPEGYKAFVSCVEKLDEFPPAPVIEHVGWNGQAYALSNGKIWSLGEKCQPSVLKRQTMTCRKKGKLKKWKRKVAAPLEGQNLPIFILSLTFLAPLLFWSNRRENVGFELTGAPGTGKSTLQLIMASALGDVTSDQGGRYWASLETVHNDLAGTMSCHRDMPLIIDEASMTLGVATPRHCTEIYGTLAFLLSGGGIEDPVTGLDTICRLATVISTNEPLASLAPLSDETKAAAAARLISLPVGTERGYGVFDFIPDGWADSREFAQDLITAARADHGCAYPRFIDKLGRALIDNEHALKAKIEKYVDVFLDLAEVDRNDGLAARVAEAFGLVYAAGRLAKKYGVLPKQLDVKDAALACYHIHLGSSGESDLSFAERLRTLLEDERVAHLRKGEAWPEQALAFVKSKKGGSELWILPENIMRVFPDWRRIQKSASVSKSMLRDKKRHTVKRMIDGKTERVHAFSIAQA